jgi:glycine C-acetyltransferase
MSNGLTTKSTTKCIYEYIEDVILNLCYKFQSHPDVVNAGKKALDDYGAGLSSVRFICGTQTIHKVCSNKFFNCVFFFC